MQRDSNFSVPQLRQRNLQVELRKKRCTYLIRLLETFVAFLIAFGSIQRGLLIMKLLLNI